MSGKGAFWSAITKPFPRPFARMTRKSRGVSAKWSNVFNDLSEDERVQLRHDVQLLTVQFSKLAMAMTGQLDHELPPETAREKQTFAATHQQRD